MGFFSSRSTGNGSGSQSDQTAAGMNRAAKAARRGGSAITTRSGRHGDAGAATNARITSDPRIQRANRDAR